MRGRRAAPGTWVVWATCAAVAMLAGSIVDGRSAAGPVVLNAPPLGAHLLTTDGRACPTATLVAGRGEATRLGVALYTDGAVRVDPCPGAPVRMRLTGTTVRGVGPWAVLETAEGVQFAGHVDPDGVELEVAGVAWLAFTNDLVAGGEDRNLRATLR